METNEGAVNTDTSGSASPAEQTITQDSAITEGQGIVTPNGEAIAAPDGNGDDREKFIPRERFDEVLTERDQFKTRMAEMEPYLPYLETLKAIGDPAALQEQIAAQERAIQQQQQGQLAQHVFQQVQTHLSDLIGDGDMDDEVAEKVATKFAPAIAQVVFERDQLRGELEQLRGTTRESRVAEQVNGLKQQYPQLDEDFVRAELLAGRDGRAVAERTHTRMQNAMLSARSQQATAQGQRDANALTLDTGASGGAARPLTMRDIANMSSEAVSKIPFAELEAAMLRQ